MNVGLFKLHVITIYLLLFSLGFGKINEKQIAVDYSYVSNNSQNISRISISTDCFYRNNHLNSYLSSLFSVSNNLDIIGSVSPKYENEELQLYYNVGVIYLPTWTSSKHISTQIHLGIHRLRFIESYDYRWYDLTINESGKYKNLGANIRFTKLFDKDWDHYQFEISMFYDVNANINAELGIVCQMLTSFEVYPTLSMRIAL